MCVKMPAVQREWGSTVFVFRWPQSIIQIIVPRFKKFPLNIFVFNEKPLTMLFFKIIFILPILLFLPD